MVSSILWRIDEAKSEFMRFNRCLNLILKEYIFMCQLDTRQVRLFL